MHIFRDIILAHPFGDSAPRRLKVSMRGTKVLSANVDRGHLVLWSAGEERPRDVEVWVCFGETVLEGETFEYRHLGTCTYDGKTIHVFLSQYARR